MYEAVSVLSATRILIERFEIGTQGKWQEGTNADDHRCRPMDIIIMHVYIMSCFVFTIRIDWNVV